MRTPRRIAVLALVAATGCARTLAYMDPVKAPGQEVLYRDGTPIVLSHGPHSEVVVEPKAGPTGRYRVERRMYFMTAVRNLSGARVEVSEANFTVTGNGGPARVVRAVEIEDEINRSAAWAQVMNAFAGAANSMAAASAGTTTFSGTVGGASFSGTAHNEGAAQQAQRQVAAETAANAAAIRERQGVQHRQLSYVIQRNTVESGDSIAGVLVVEPPRATACKVMTSPGEPGVPATVYTRAVPAIPPGYGPGPCRMTVTVSVAGDAHAISFDEVFLDR
jgi:hypothetical protein